MQRAHQRTAGLAPVRVAEVDQDVERAQPFEELVVPDVGDDRDAVAHTASSQGALDVPMRARSPDEHAAHVRADPRERGKQRFDALARVEISRDPHDHLVPPGNPVTESDSSLARRIDLVVAFHQRMRRHDDGGPASDSEQVVTREPRMHDHGPRSPDRLRAPRDPERILEVGVASGGRHRFRAGGLRQRVVREPQPVHQPVERQIVEDDDPRVPHREPVDRPVELDVVPQLEDADVRRANALLGAGSRWPHRVDVVFGGEPDLVEPAQHRRGVRRDPRLRGGQGGAERDVRHRLTRPSGGRPPATAGCGR